MLPGAFGPRKDSVDHNFYKTADPYSKGFYDVSISNTHFLRSFWRPPTSPMVGSVLLECELRCCVDLSSEAFDEVV